MVIFNRHVNRVTMGSLMDLWKVVAMFPDLLRHGCGLKYPDAPYMEYLPTKLAHFWVKCTLW